MYIYNIDPTKISKQFKKYSHFLVTLRGVFLALILFCASFLAPYIGCNYQKILKSHQSVRYLLLFLVIYFSINLVDPDIETNENPIYSIIKSVFVFIIFLVLNTIDVTGIVMMLVLFTLLIITSKYHSYFKGALQSKDDALLTALNIIQIVLSVSIVILLFVSSILKTGRQTSSPLKLQKCRGIH